MFRAFSGSCMSLEDMNTVNRPQLLERPHLLGPGKDFFTEDGLPVQPNTAAEQLQKVFSGSSLDLNAMNGEAPSDEEQPQPMSASPTVTTTRGLPTSGIFNQLSETDATRNGKNKIHVLVIGDNSYVASHIVSKVLEAGYSVRVTLPPSQTQQQQSDFYGSRRDLAHRLTIHEADMANSAALRDVIRGCRYIVHCGCPNAEGASAVAYNTAAVQALFEGIRLSGKSTVKRVVLTGSASSVFSPNDPAPASGAFDESSWNTVATERTEPVAVGKMVFEKEAWRLRQMLGVELVVLLPSVTIGPSRTEATSEVMDIIHSMASASAYFPFAPRLYWNFVDVADVAEAHLRAMETPEARDQRIIISGQCVAVIDLCHMIKARFPHLPAPTRSANTLLTLLVAAMSYGRRADLGFIWRNIGVRKPLSNARAVEVLHMHFTPLDDTVAACIEQMIRAGELPAADSVVASRAARPTSRLVVGATVVCAAGAVLAYALLRKR